MTPPDHELVPAAVDALLALWADVLAGLEPGWKILDGDSVNWTTGRFLTVGMAGDDDIAEALSERPGLGRRRSDAADIANALWCATGDKTIKPRRDEVFAAFRLVRDAVRDNQTLGGATTRAEVVSYVYEPYRSPRGCGASIRFTTRVVQL